jgi:hypothetical protein
VLAKEASKMANEAVVCYEIDSDGYDMWIYPELPEFPVSLVLERDYDQALATISDLRRQIGGAEAKGFSEGIRMAAEACSDSDGWDMHPKDYYGLILSLLPKPSEEVPNER